MSSSVSKACAAVRDLLPLLPSQDLDPARSAAVREHLQGCFPCAQELGEWLRSRQKLTGLSDGAGVAPEFFDDLEQSILARLRGDAALPAAPRWRATWAFAMSKRVWSGVAASAALFLMGLLLVRLWMPDGPRLLDDARPASTTARPGRRKA